MTVYSPDGVRYDMTQAVGVPNGTASPFGGFYTTQITDRNGNSVTIAYTQSGSPEVSNITTSDGRRIDFAYYGLTSSESTRRINTITSSYSTGSPATAADFNRFWATVSIAKTTGKKMFLY